MAGGFDRFRHSEAGFREILKSDGVQRMLQGKADRVAAAVEAHADELGEDWEIVADVQVGKNRAGAMVSGVPLDIEARQGIMASAIDAANGG